MKPTLIKKLDSRLYSGKMRSFGLFSCRYCNNTFEALISSVNIGDKKTCGCKTNQLKANITHSLSKHPLYRIWIAIRQRCNNAKSFGYKNYGARGISICLEWDNDFKTFYDWSLFNGYKKGLSIDRINNDGNYEPSNCRWTTTTIQNCNKRFYPSDSGYIGVAISGKKFIASVSICDKKKHIGFFKTALEGALARDLYIIDNNLPNKRNFILKD